MESTGGSSRTIAALRRASTAALLIAVSAAGPPGAAHAGDAPALRKARDALQGGRPQDAYDAAIAGLSAAPGDLDLLAVGVDAAVALDRKDDALWLASAGRLAAVGAGAKPRVAAFEERVAALDPLAPEERAPVDAYARALLETARTCARKKLWVNAVQILARLEGSVVGPEAEAEIEKVRANKVALTALLDSEVEVPETRTDRKIAARAAKEDGKHAAWDTAWKVDSPSYTVVTDTGFVLANRASSAMEQINRHYRTVFQVGLKERTPTPRCTARLFRTRQEYETIGKAPDESLGFYQPGENSVNLYDPRSDGRPLAALWPVAFHEASHQFTEMISKVPVPSWLNEGTACSFEGAHLRPDGKVEVNLIPVGRLADAVAAVRDSDPTIRQVLEYEQPGSYPAAYYGTGWAIVEFLRSWEDAKCERPYAKAYDAIVDSYRTGKSGGSMERFVRYVVEAPHLPGVGSYDQWEERFRDWLRETADLHLGPPSTAGLFVERGDRHRAAGKNAAAEEDYRYALRRAPGHVDALLRLSELLQARGRRDEALSLVRRVVESLRKDGILAAGFAALDREAAAKAALAARERIAAMDKDVAASLDVVDRSIVDRAQAAAEAYVAKGFPRAALTLLDTVLPLVDGDDDLDLMRTRIAQEASVEVLLPSAVRVEAGLPGWFACPEVTASDGVVRARCDAAGRAALLDADLPSRYRFEATVKAKRVGDGGLAGLLFGCDPGGAWEAVGRGKDYVEIWKILETTDLVASPGPLTEAEAASFRLAVEVRPGLARVYVDGKVFADQEYPAGELRGGIGLYADRADVEFSDLRLLVPTGRYFRD